MIGTLAATAGIAGLGVLLAGQADEPPTIPDGDEVVLPGRADAGALPEDPVGAQDDGERPCEPAAACTRWELTLDDRPVSHHGDLVVARRHDAVLAFGSISGQLRWIHSERGLPGVPAAMPRSAHGVGPTGLLVDYDGRLLLHRRADGEVRWALDTDLRAVEVVDVDDRALLVAGDGRLLVLDAATGRQWWQRPIASDREPVLLAEGLVLVPEPDGGTSAVGARDGEERWQRPQAISVLGPPVGRSGQTPGRSVLAVDGTDGIEVVEPTTGVTTLAFGLADEVELVGPWLLVDGRDLHGPTDGALVARLNGRFVTSLRTGSEVVVATVGASRRSPSVLDVTALDAATGAERWRTRLWGPLGWRPTSLARVQGIGAIQVGGRDGSVVMLDADTGELLERRTMAGPEGGRVEWAGELGLVQEGSKVVAVVGPGGRLDLDAPAELVAVAPLVLRGPDGLLRPDETVLRGFADR